MKKGLSILVAVILLCSLTPISVASEGSYLPYVYTLPDGIEIHYNLDAESGIPYTVIDGERMFVMLPLPQFMVTDEEKIQELNKGINEENQLTTPGISNYGIPPSVDQKRLYDLTTNDVKVASVQKGEDGIVLNSGSTYRTYFYKVHLNHTVVRFKITPHGGGFLGTYVGAARELNLQGYAQDLYGTWYDWGLFNDIDCSGSNGIAFVKLSIYQYVVFDLARGSNYEIDNFDYVVWTNYLHT